MSKKKSVTIVFCGLSLCLSCILCAQAEGNVYRLPYQKSIHCSKDSNGRNACNFPKESSLEMARCSSRAGLTYCTNQKNEPITGEIVRYQDGLVVRRYVMKDGYLDGVGESYDRNGYRTSALTYTKGKLNGDLTTYNRDGSLSSKIPYIDGKKEGIAEYIGEKTTLKTIYIDDKLNGSAQIWSNSEKKKIYDLEMSDDYIINATYHHYDECYYNGYHPSDKSFIKKEEVPKILIDALNLGCAELRDTFSRKIYPVKLMISTNDCKNWENENRKTLEALVKKFKCPKDDKKG